MNIDPKDQATIADMLAFRQQLKDELGPEVYEERLMPYKNAIHKHMIDFPFLDEVAVADLVVDAIDANTSITDDDVKEIYKALYGLAAVELQGEPFINALIEASKTV